MFSCFLGPAEIPNMTCINMTHSPESNCVVCYDSTCPVTQEEAFVSFGQSIFQDSLLENSSLHGKAFSCSCANIFIHKPLGPSIETTPSPSENSSHCPSVPFPSREAEYGCIYIANVRSDGCVQCYSYACLHCNNSDHGVDNGSEISLPTNDASKL